MVRSTGSARLVRLCLPAFLVLVACLSSLGAVVWGQGSNPPPPGVAAPPDARAPTGNQVGGQTQAEAEPARQERVRRRQRGQSELTEAERQRREERRRERRERRNQQEATSSPAPAQTGEPVSPAGTTPDTTPANGTAPSPAPSGGTPTTPQSSGAPQAEGTTLGAAGPSATTGTPAAPNAAPGAPVPAEDAPTTGTPAAPRPALGNSSAGTAGSVPQPTVPTPPITPSRTLPDTPRSAPRPTPSPVQPRRAPVVSVAARKAAVKPAPALPVKPPIPVGLVSWQETFERAPMGFDRATPTHLYADVRVLAAAIGKSPELVLDTLLAVDLGFWVGLAMLVLFLAVGLAVEVKQPRKWRRIWVSLAAVHKHGPIWRGIIAIIQRAAVPLAALLCWSVGVSLADGETDLTILVQLLLALWCGYRVVDEAARQVVGHAPPGSTVGEILPAFHRLLLFAAIWAAVWLIGDRLGYRADVVALWVALGHLLLVLGIFHLLRRRDRVLSLLPDSGNRTYLAFRRFLVAIYYPLVYFSLVVSLLWVAGYRNMGAIVLARSWAVAGICIAGMGLYRASRRVIERWTPPDPERPTLREEVIGAREHLVAAMLLLLAVSSITQVLGLTEPLVHWARLTWLSVGAFRITGRGLWTSALVVLGMLLLSRWMQTTLAYRVYPRLGVGTGESYALNRLLHYTLAAGSILLVLNSLGISPSSLALVVGGLSVGIGFGLQDIARNIASGLILLTSRQVRQGDVISVGDQLGRVRDVNLRSTLVTNADNVDLLIPNAKLLGDTLINWTYTSPTVRTRVPFGAAATADPEQVMKEAVMIARALPEVLETPAPDVQLVELGEKTHKYELLVWVELDDSGVRARVVSELYRRILETFPTHGIDVPVAR